MPLTDETEDKPAYVNFSSSVVLQYYMVSFLKLGGTDLMCYSWIVNFSADGDFHRISLSFFQKWCYRDGQNLTKMAVASAIDRLEEKKLIEVHRIPGKACEYKARKEPIKAAYRKMLELNKNAEVKVNKHSPKKSLFQQAKDSVDEKVKKEKEAMHILPDDEEIRKILSKRIYF